MINGQIVRRTGLTLVLAAGLWVAAGLTGCVEWDGDGQGAYTLRNQYRTEVESIYVPIWTRGKDVYRRNLEFRLTEAIIKRIQMDTDYRITERARADSELVGRILSVEQSVLGFNPDSGDPREMEVVIVLSFAWRDLKTGKVLVDEPNLRVTGTYIPESPLSEDFFQGSQDVIEKASRRVVEHMEADWGTDTPNPEPSDEDAQS